MTASAAAADADGDALIFQSSALPPGITIDAQTGLISGTIAPGAASGSPYAVEITVADGDGGTASDTFRWTVSDASAPAAPRALSATVSTTAVFLDWDDNAESDVAGYRVYRSSSEGGPYTALVSGSIAGSEYLDQTAPPGAESYYRVTAINTAGNESPAAATSAARKIFLRAASAAAKTATTKLVISATGRLAGDAMVATIAVTGTPTITAPAGWQLVRQDVNASAMRQATYVKIATAKESGSYTWTFGGSQSAAGVIAAYGGVSGPAPVASSGGQVGTTTSITAPSTTTSLPGSLLVGGFGIATSTAIEPPPGMIERGEVSAAGKTGLKVTVAVADAIQAAAGASGARSASAQSAAANIGHLVALNPAA